MASGFLTFNRGLIKKLFWVVHAKSISNLCKLSRLYSHWIFRLYFCTPYPNLGKLITIQWIWAKYRELSVANRSIICQSRRLKQMIDLFYHWFDHRICFLMNWSSGNEATCHFYARAITRWRKAWFHLRMSRISIAAKLSQTLEPCSNFSRVFVLFTEQANLSGRNWSPQLRRSRLSFNRSSVSQVKDINIKNTQREDRKACFKFFTVCFRSIKLYL